MRYFKAMPRDVGIGTNCLKTHTVLYIWTMGTILFVYLGFVFTVFYFCRSYCRDPEIDEEERQEELKSIALYESRLKEKNHGNDLSQPLIGKSPEENYI